MYENEESKQEEINNNDIEIKEESKEKINNENIEIKEESKEQENEKKERLYKGTHIKKKYLIFPIVCLVGVLIYNIFKTPSTNNKPIEEPKKEAKEQKQLNLELETDYSKMIVTDRGVEAENNQDKIDNSIQQNNVMENKKVIQTSKRELSEEEREALRKIREEANNAKRSSISFPVNQNQRENRVAQNDTNRNYSDYDLNRQGSKKSFLNNEPTYSNYISSKLEGSVSPFEVKAGDFIPAIVITAMDSDLPSKVITAQVRENVFDTVTGNYLLIPQGTRITGTYDSNVTWGQNRLLVIWQRMIFPNGMSINLDNMQGVDLTGQAGLTGKVNNHFATLMKGVLLSSAMGATAAIVTQDNSNNDDWKYAAGQGAGQTIVKVGDKFADKALDRQPTIQIKQGDRFNIMVHSDLILKPYK